MGRPNPATDEAVFLTCIRSASGLRLARLLIESLREFGGPMRDSTIRVYATRPEVETGEALIGPGVCVKPLLIPEAVRPWPYGDKVEACADAEAESGAGTTLVWMDTECLVVAPPTLMLLDPDHDVALRPVHIRNVGLPKDAPLDDYWRSIYSVVGIADTVRTVEPFVEGGRVRAYYNSHGFAVRGDLGLLGRWREAYRRLIADPTFSTVVCAEPRRRVFVFQAVFSALVSACVPEDRIRILPPTYNYPYNLHLSVPQDGRARALNDLVCFTFEERDIRPDAIDDIEVHEPLRSWLADQPMDTRQQPSQSS